MAGVHVPVLHIVGSLPDPLAEVAKLLHTTSWYYQRSQASEFLDFLDVIAPEMLRLKEGNQVHVALVNVPKTHAVKVVHCVGLGYSPIGAKPTQVNGKLLFLHGGGNKEFGPPQPLCLQSSMVERKIMAVMTEAKFTTTITAKGAAYTYPLLAKPNVTNTEQSICMVCSVFVALDFARRGYVYAAPLAVMVAVNCVSVITSTVFLSTIDYGRHNDCGGPNSCLPFPCKKIIFHRPLLVLL